jgi:drug/metabolite transporter (DMT)-like permease
VSTDGRGYLAVTVAAALWGIAGATAKYLFASREVPPFLLVQVRMGLSFLILALILGATAPRLLRLQRTDLPFLAVWGVLGMALVQFTYLFTISKTNVATAIFLQYLAPMVTAVYAWRFERQRLGGLLITCLTVAMGGSLLLIFGGTARLLVSPLGLASGLASAGFMSFYTIYGAKRVSRLSPWTLLCYGLGFGFAFWLLVDAGLAVAGRPVPGLHLLSSGAMWAFFGYIAILATIVPFGLYLTGLRSISPTQATITGMLEPVVGGIAAFLALGESLRWGQVAGGGLIVVAVILLQVGQSRSKATAKSPHPAAG